MSRSVHVLVLLSCILTSQTCVGNWLRLQRDVRAAETLGTVSGDAGDTPEIKSHQHKEELKKVRGGAEDALLADIHITGID